MNLLFYFGNDFFFSTQLVETAKVLGYQVRLVGSIADISNTSFVDLTQRGEALHGQTADLVRCLVDAQPRLLVFDLNNRDLPWIDWISVVKSNASTRRIPILAFGSHIAADVLTAGQQAGADKVVSNGQFAKQLPVLMQSLLSQNEPIQWDADIASQVLPDLAQSGIAYFNAGAFYRAHDDLEAAWVAEPSAVRELYRAILQVGIAYYQIQRGNYNGALKMFLRVKQWLNRLPDVCQTVDVAQLRLDAAAAEARLLQLGASQVAVFPVALFRPIQLRVASG
jgi:CheY-like chemotaxis protein